MPNNYTDIELNNGSSQRLLHSSVVGELVSFLLNKQLTVEWKDMGDSFSFRGTTLCLDDSNGVLSLVNKGKQACVLNGLLYYYDTDFHPLSIAVNIGLLAPDQNIGCLPKPKGASMIGLIDGSRRIVMAL